MTLSYKVHAGHCDLTIKGRLIIREEDGKDSDEKRFSVAVT